MLIAGFLVAGISSGSLAQYDPEAPMHVRQISFAADRPSGLGRYVPLKKAEYANAEDVYIYIEVSNCKALKDKLHFRTTLAMDVEIYYEDGLKIFSHEEAASLDVLHPRKKNESYIWTKINTSSLKEGEYKVEMRITDENSDKEAFALTRFRVL